MVGALKRNTLFFTRTSRKVLRGSDTGFACALLALIHGSIIQTNKVMGSMPVQWKWEP
jgi:hypothetical protein